VKDDSKFLTSSKSSTPINRGGVPAQKSSRAYFAKSALMNLNGPLEGKNSSDPKL